MRTISAKAPTSPVRHAATSSASLDRPIGLVSSVMGTLRAPRRLQTSSDADDLEVRVLEEIEELLARERGLGRDLDVAPLGLGLEAVVVLHPVLPRAARAAGSGELQVHAHRVGSGEVVAALELSGLGLEHDPAEDDGRLAALDHAAE